MSAETPATRREDQAGSHRPDGVIRPGLRVLESDDPIAAARRLRVDRGGEVAWNLRDAIRALRTRITAIERSREVARARQAVALAEQVDGFDEQADAELIGRRSELEAAAELGDDAPARIAALQQRVGMLQLVEHEERVARDALEVARRGLPLELPAHVDTIALRHARDGVLAAVAHREQADRDLAEAHADEVALAAEVDPEQAQAALAEAHEEKRAAEARHRSRRLLVQATAVGGAGGCLALAALAGILGPVVGAGLAAALLPPAVELLRRSRATVVASRARVRQAEERSHEAARRHLARLEAAHRRRLACEQRRAEAQRARFEALTDWRHVVGPGIGEEHAAPILEIIAEVATRRPALKTATAAAENVRRAFARELASLGAPPELDAYEGLDHVKRLAALRPVAAASLEAVAEAERRMLLRQQLAALAGRSDLAALRRTANRRLSPRRMPLVIVDDGDALARPPVVELLRELADSIAVAVVTQRASRWEPAHLPAIRSTGELEA